MTFIWSSMLFSLLLLPLLIALYVRLQRRRQKFAASFGSLGVMQDSSGKPARMRRHVPSILFFASLAILFVGLARPQTKVSVPRIEGTVILAFDVSGSMAADDMKPSRMEAAKAAAREFVSHQPASVKIGIVAFSDSGFSVQALTNDQNNILASISRLSPQRGTSIGQGIAVSLHALQSDLAPASHLYSSLTPVPVPTATLMPAGEYTNAVIVLLTDGENNMSPNPLAAAQKAKDRGVRIYTVGIGSPAGVTLKVNGFTVHTQLDEATLKNISQLTGGKYFNAATEKELQEIYDNLDLQLVVKPEKMEVTSLFAGASILIMIIGGALSLLWFGRLP